MSAKWLFTFKHIKFPLLPLLTHSALSLTKVFVSVFALNSPRLVTLVVRVAQVVEVHLELNTDGNIVPSESE